MGDVHYIVDKLNAPPFNFSETLISFSEKTPEELLQLLSDVSAKINPRHQRHIAHESPDQTADRIAGFLKIVNYQPSLVPGTFRQLLAAADRDVIHGVLKWVLSQGQMLEKRAFVGYYLSFPDMPDELSYDPDVMELKEVIKGLQGEFIEAHKALDAAQQEVKDLPQLRSLIKQMEEEKERLGEKVDRAANQATALPDASNYRDICVALRQEHDREVAISQQLQAQQQQLDRAEANHQRSAGRLREMEQHLAVQGGLEADASKMLEVLQDDVARLRQQITTKWPRELEGKQRRLAAVKETLNNGINTEGDLQRLLSQESALRQQIASIQDKQAALDRARAADRAFLQVRQAQQMASLVARKKSELASKVERLQQKRDSLAATIDSSSSRSGAAAADAGGVSDEEWRAKYDSIKAKLPSYKTMKKELGDLEAEVFVLNRTCEVLQQQEQDLQGQIQKLERKAGVQGYADLAAGLEKVSEEKGAADEAKGAVLQEVSNTVEQITAAVQQKKVQLAPAIQELRTLRQQCQEVEAAQAERKAAYEAALGGLEGTVAGLETQVAALKAEVDKSSSELDKVKARNDELEGHIRRITATGGDELKRRCQAQLAESEGTLRNLREQQRNVKDKHSHGLAQIDMMTDLIRLLQLKQRVLQQAGSYYSGTVGVDRPATGTGMPGAHSYDTNVMVL